MQIMFGFLNLKVNHINQLPLTLQACRRIFSEISLDMHQCRIGPLHSLKMTKTNNHLIFSYDTQTSLQNTE